MRRIAVVTGAGSGIGRASAVALAATGFDLMLAGRRQTALEETAALIAEATPDARVVVRPTDIGTAEDCTALMDDTMQRLGRIDAFVNAGAICESATLLEASAELWDRTLDINLRGSALCSAEAAKRMRVTGGGRIVLISSISDSISEPESGPYSASKAGVSSLARSFAVDLGDQGIAVNAVAPGWVQTPMTPDFVAEATREDIRRLNPLGRLGRAEEIANLVVYLAKESPLFLTGTTIVIDGGQMAAAVMPW